jgi:hypothetical protein
MKTPFLTSELVLIKAEAFRMFQCPHLFVAKKPNVQPLSFDQCCGVIAACYGFETYNELCQSSSKTVTKKYLKFNMSIKVKKEQKVRLDAALSELGFEMEVDFPHDYFLNTIERATSASDINCVYIYREPHQKNFDEYDFDEGYCAYILVNTNTEVVHQLQFQQNEVQLFSPFFINCHDNNFQEHPVVSVEEGILKKLLAGGGNGTR